MGTKNNPGKFDCYAGADADEPMFVLLARDRHAELLVRLWAMLRELEGEDAECVAEARGVATAIQRWQEAHGRGGLAPAKVGQVLACARLALKYDAPVSRR